MNIFSFSTPAKRTNSAITTTRYVKLGKKRRNSSKCKYYIISSRMVIKVIIIFSAFYECEGMATTDTAAQDHTRCTHLHFNA